MVSVPKNKLGTIATLGMVALAVGMVVSVAYDACRPTATAHHGFQTGGTQGASIGVQQQAWQEVSPPGVSGIIANYAPAGFATNTLLRINCTAACNLTGFQALAAGSTVCVESVGAGAMTANHLNPSSSAANQLMLPGTNVNGASWAITSGGTIFCFIYDPTVNSGSGAWVNYSGLTSTNLPALNAGSTAFTADVTLGGFYETVQTTAACSGNTVDLALNNGTTTLAVNATSGSCQLLGIVAPATPRCIWVVNTGTASFSWLNENATETTAANRIETFGGGAWGQAINGASGSSAVYLCYSLAVSRWQMRSIPGLVIPGLTASGSFNAQAGISLTGTGDLNIQSTNHFRCTGTAVTSFSNASCTGTKCTDCLGVITTSSTAPAINFQSTYTGANDAACLIQPYGTAAAATSVAHTATQLSFTATSGGVYSYFCGGTQ